MAGNALLETIGHEYGVIIIVVGPDEKMSDGSIANEINTIHTNVDEVPEILGHVALTVHRRNLAAESEGEGALH